LTWSWQSVTVEAFFHGLVDRLLDDPYKGMRTLADEIFHKEFILEATKAEEFRVSATRWQKRLNHNLRLIAGPEPLSDEITDAFGDVLETAKHFWRVIFQVLLVARPGIEIGISLPQFEQEAHCRLVGVRDKMDVLRRLLHEFVDAQGGGNRSSERSQ
jgi:hypothetical protein